MTLKELKDILNQYPDDIEIAKSRLTESPEETIYVHDEKLVIDTSLYTYDREWRGY